MCLLCLSWKEDANQAEVKRSVCHGRKVRTRQRSQGGERKWFYHKAIKNAYQIDSHSSDTRRMKGPSSMRFLLNFCVIRGQIKWKLKSLTKFFFLFSFQLFATFHAWMEASVVLEINASALLITLVNSVRSLCRLPILQNYTITHNRWTRL